MTDVHSQEVRGTSREHQQRPWGGPRDNQMAKVEGSTSATGGFCFVISGTTVTGTVTALMVVTPFIVLFSPILVTVFVIIFLLATGFITAREVGVAAKTGLARMYKYVTDANRNRIQEDSFDQETNKFGLRVREMKYRDERLSEGGRYETGGFDTTIEPEESSHNLVKAATAATTGTSLVVFSGLTFIGTVMALVLATLPLVIFSPVLMPAFITVFLLASGFVSSGGFGVAAASVLAWTYRYATKGRPTETSHMFGSKPQLSRNEETRMFGSKSQEWRNEETRMFGSKSGNQGDREESRKPDSKMWETRDRDFYETIETQGGNYQVAKAATATTVGGSLLVLSSLTFIGTVIGLTVATPLMVIFSPVLVPAMITVFLLASGLFASGGFSVAAVTTLGWLYKYVTNENPRERNLLDRESGKQGSTRERMDEHLSEEGYRVTNRDRVSPASHHQV